MRTKNLHLLYKGMIISLQQKDLQMRKWYSLIDKVYLRPNLLEAFNRVKRNKGGKTSGVDGISVKGFKERLGENLYQLHEELKSGTYEPQAVKRVYIAKEDGSKRPLGIPTVRDRVVQQALLNILQPIFEPEFHPSSYGYRPNRSAHHAVAKAERFTRHYGLDQVVDMDLSKCFDTLDHHLILSSVNEKVSDGKVLNLISSFLKSGIVEDGKLSPTEIGCPQGGIISPLLTNIYLNRFDHYMKDKGVRIVRYADDILIFAATRSQAGSFKAIATKFLEDDLKLKVNVNKTHLTNLDQGIPYLGFVLRTIGVSVSEKSIQKFKEKVRKLTPRNQGRKLHCYIDELNLLLRGYSMYYRVALSKKLFANLMSWIRRRLRMMIMRSWKSWKALHKQLRRMGYKGKFEKISVTRWRNSSCQLLHMALPNSWFDGKHLFNMERVKTNTLHQYYDFVLNKV
ncbi:MAG: group II intron reverse transcriptase/maturase [Marinilabiliaceae bacterium]|nr:group II intron reverse transcriptase/maturase [Marinilabiliaceae bacterium]